MMNSAQVVETSVNVTTNSPSQDFTHPDDHTSLTSGLLVLLKEDTCVQIQGGSFKARAASCCI